MTRTALLAIVVGVLSAGCVVTTGGKASRSTPIQHQHHQSAGSPQRGAAPAPAPVAQQGGGQATAAPPIATPVPANPATPAVAPVHVTGSRPPLGANVHQEPAGHTARPPIVGRPPTVPVPTNEEEEKKEHKKKPQPLPVYR